MLKKIKLKKNGGLRKKEEVPTMRKS